MSHAQASTPGSPSPSAPPRDSAWRTRFGGAALVTGASSGIGEAFAHALAARGMDLVLVALDLARLETLARTLEARHGIRAIALATDLSQTDAVSHVRSAAESAGLHVGLLINNAGYAVYGPFVGQDPIDQAGMVDVNCRAPASLARAFAPAMVAKGRGGIIFVSSTAAYQPTPHFAVYAATKAFDLFLAEALWAELAQHGVEVLGISPGHAHTEFQVRSGDPITSPPGGVAQVHEIVETALDALGRRPSAIHGRRNTAIAVLTRVMPRALIIDRARRYFEKLDRARPTPESLAHARRRPLPGENGRFARAVVRMIAAFLAVAFIDVVVCSLITHRLRFWFPAWLDAHWDTRIDGWVTYSQSYFAGIVFIPVLAAEVVREFIPRAAASARAAILLGTLAILAFMAWWKGGLMLQYHKGQEALAWIALTLVTWGLIRLGEELPARVARVTARGLAAGLARGVSVFFLAMAVIDPVLCVGVQGLPWSTGLLVEMGFFVPAGVVLWLVARWLSAGPRPAATRAAISAVGAV